MWPKAVIWIVVAIVAVVAAIAVAGRVTWQSRVRDLTRELSAASDAADLAHPGKGELSAAPDPVRRYLNTALTPDQRRVTAVTIEHSGTFNMGDNDERWRPFTSTQSVVIDRPGFVWNARIAMAPGLPARVLDAYVAGRGVLTAKLLGLVTVMKQPSTPELAQGELMRFLAEAAWYPTALIPGQGVSWEPIDNRRAMVTLRDDIVSVSLEVRFGDDGMVESVYSDGRYRDVDGVQVATPWEGRFWNYQQDLTGMMVPLDGEVAWMLPEGRRPYWRGHIERISYEFAE